MKPSTLTADWPIYKINADIEFLRQVETVQPQINREIEKHPWLVLKYVSVVPVDGLFLDGGKITIAVKADKTTPENDIIAEVQSIAEKILPGTLSSWACQAVLITDEVITPTITQAKDIAVQAARVALPWVGVAIAGIALLVILRIK